jgi:hypothetical protein
MQINSSDTMVPNWQTGPSESHSLAAGTAGGMAHYGSRPHQDAPDHTGTFTPGFSIDNSCPLISIPQHRFSPDHVGFARFCTPLILH